eukprot:10863664-Karenia_brevis.AAC.1
MWEESGGADVEGDSNRLGQKWRNGGGNKRNWSTWGKPSGHGKHGKWDKPTHSAIRGEDMVWNLKANKWEKSWGKHAWGGHGSSSHDWESSSSNDGWGSYWKNRKTSDWNQNHGA